MVDGGHVQIKDEGVEGLGVDIVVGGAEDWK